MLKPEPLNHDSASLAEQVRCEAQPFIDAALKIFKERITSEYYRCRGYAYEAGLSEMRLNAHVVFCFDPNRLGVTVSTSPQFIPAPQVSHESIQLIQR